MQTLWASLMLSSEKPHHPYARGDEIQEVRLSDHPPFFVLPCTTVLQLDF